MERRGVKPGDGGAGLTAAAPGVTATAGDHSYPVSLLPSVITVSAKTVTLVPSLPAGVVEGE